VSGSWWGSWRRRGGRARSPLTAHLLPLTVLLACARVQAPPGGPTDLAPPRIVATVPDSLAVLPNFKGDVEFRFDEVISEGASPNFGLGTGDLEKLVMLSPSLAVPEVRWRRTRITVRPREGWRPNTVYRVELLPGLPDLSSNRSKEGRVVTFTTGAPLPTARLWGRVVDWTTQRPLARGLVEAILLPDSLPYRTSADSTGRFSLGPLPAGQYLVYAALDQNNDFRFDRREPFDSVQLAAGQDSVGELWTFRHDSAAARLSSVSVNDSLSLVLTFSQLLNPYQSLPPDSLELRLLPDSVAVPVLRILPRELFDSLYPVRRPVDTTAAGRARADSLRADSSARARTDSLRADSVARAREAQRIRIPGVARRQEAARDTLENRPLRTRPAPFDKLYVRLRSRLTPGSSYAVIVHGVQNLSRIAGTLRAQLKVPEVKPAADSSKVKPDTTGKRPVPPGGFPAPP
jgi:Big-like domain-containing protein